MSRILIWSPNYAPELIGIPPLVTDLAEWLAARGHGVDLVTAFPNYPERRIRPEYRGAIWRSETQNGVRVHRSWLRVRPAERFLDKALYEASFAAISLPRLLTRLRTADAVVCVVPSLIAAAVSASVVRRPRLVLWVQDLVADAARSVADAPGGALRAARSLERLAATHADRVVVCSPGFRDHLVRRGVAADRIETILNWVDTSSITRTPAPANGRPTRFLYAGNIGYTHGFETLAAAARELDGVELELVGAGNAAAAASALGLRVRPPVEKEEYPRLLTSADVHIVIQRGLAAGANLPSKIASYLASGRPIVASIGLDTPAADLLRASGGAIVVAPEQPALLAEAMVRLRDDAALRHELGSRAREYAVEHLDKDAALTRLEAVIVG